MFGSTSGSSHLRFGILCALSYLMVSWVVRFDMVRGTQIASLVYPFDTFSMYSTMPEAQSSHLLARDERGDVHSITSFRSFDCDAPIDSRASACGTRATIQYLDDDLVDYIQTHPGSGSSQVDIIRRTWMVFAGRPPRPSGDCVITACRVSR
ncbi:hypothetical protein [Paraliomyxa miuraensis]|uniref:hypothetical protein n=1 Tax=Paraliomyxa miuraensis TaxID=376150 RepID=UPI00224EE7E8|nr:hypothetical protein [Paraliomyxa miuraensis]MCX4243660.1 hypothetical protein [Paraliomyxa miuraensis]